MYIIDHHRFAIYYVCIRPFLQGSNQGCGAGAQISDSSSRYLNFWLWLRHLEAFGSSSRTICSKNQKKYCIICLTHFLHKLSLWNWNPNFQLQLHHLNIFGSGSSHRKLLGFGLQLHSPGSIAVISKFNAMLSSK